MLLPALAATAVAAAAAFAVLWASVDWPEDGADFYPGGVTLRDDAGSVLRVSLGPGDVDCRPCYEADADDWIAKAVVASEDGEFWTHCGVRPLSVVRAAFQNVTWRRRISGASTITMQAARLIRPHPKTLLWKAREAVMALKMERVRDKRWILSQYLNRAPFGSNLVGIEAAASGWFGKSAKTLGLGEAAMLAGMVQAPSRFRPDRRYERAIKRRDYVLGRMLELGMVDEAQVEAEKSIRPEVCRARRSTPTYSFWPRTRSGRRLRRAGILLRPSSCALRRARSSRLRAAGTTSAARADRSTLLFRRVRPGRRSSRSLRRWRWTGESRCRPR